MSDDGFRVFVKAEPTECGDLRVIMSVRIGGDGVLSAGSMTYEGRKY